MAAVVSFVIPALNEAEMIAGLLGSIAALRCPVGVTVHETIVVDAKSSDNTAAIARSMGCAVVEAGRGSIAQLRNIGAAQASGSVFAFVDADCRLPADWVAAVASALADDRVVAAGCGMAPPRSSSTWVERTWFELAHRGGGVEASSGVRWLSTLNLAVRRESFKKVGGFDETLATCEDVDLGYRLKALGALVRIDCCKVVHLRESKSVGEFFRRESWRARGAVRGLSQHWRYPREVASFFLPIVVSLCAFGGLAFMVAPWCESPLPEHWGRLEVIGATLLVAPTTLLVMHRRVPVRFILSSWLLLLLYFFARTLGTAVTFSRVERADRAQAGEAEMRHTGPR